MLVRSLPLLVFIKVYFLRMDVDCKVDPMVATGHIFFFTQITLKKNIYKLIVNILTSNILWFA